MLFVTDSVLMLAFFRLVNRPSDVLRHHFKVSNKLAKLYVTPSRKRHRLNAAYQRNMTQNEDSYLISPITFHLRQRLLEIVKVAFPLPESLQLFHFRLQLDVAAQLVTVGREGVAAAAAVAGTAGCCCAGF